MNIFRIILTSTILVILFACGGDRDSRMVKEVADDFLYALVSGDLSTAKNLSTAQTVERWSDSAVLDMSAVTEDICSAITNEKFFIADSIKVVENTAELTSSRALPCLVGSITILHFVRENGRWLVNEPLVLLKEVILSESTSSVPDSVKVGE